MKNTWHKILAVLLVLSGLSCNSLQAQPKSLPGKDTFKVVLDPGHGGKDLGCRGRTQNEKTIVLDVAKRIADLAATHPSDSIATTLTRQTDTFIPLEDRARTANDAEADLFVSIHVNSIDARSKGRAKVHGASVYTVGLHKSEANLGVAMRENGVIELEEDFSERYQGFDPSSSESYIIFELDQNRHISQSVEFASIAQNKLITHAGRADKGVLQAGFLVLWATSMPSVLVELDFICNPEAEEFLASQKGRQKCAEAIYNALVEYKNKYHKRSND